MGKLKKNQQQTPYQQQSEDLGSLVAIKAKSLGKKNPTALSSIRQKNGQKNLIKVLKSSVNQDAHRKTEKMN